MKKISLSNLNHFPIYFHILILGSPSRIKMFSFWFLTYIWWWHVREMPERCYMFPYRFRLNIFCIGHLCHLVHCSRKAPALSEIEISFRYEAVENLLPNTYAQDCLKNEGNWDISLRDPWQQLRGWILYQDSSDRWASQ